jgi:hypothetical protein
VRLWIFGKKADFFVGVVRFAISQPIFVRKARELRVLHTLEIGFKKIAFFRWMAIRTNRKTVHPGPIFTR